jgi:hypothetical protein
LILLGVASAALAQGFGFGMGVDDASLRNKTPAGPPAVNGNLLLLAGGNVSLLGGGIITCVGLC